MPIPYEGDTIPIYVKDIVNIYTGHLVGEMLINHFLYPMKKWQYRYSIVCSIDSRDDIAAHCEQRRIAFIEETQIGDSDIVIPVDKYKKGEDDIYIYFGQLEEIIGCGWNSTISCISWNGQNITVNDEHGYSFIKQGQLIPKNNFLAEEYIINMYFKNNITTHGVFICPCGRLFWHYPLYTLHVQSGHMDIIRKNQRLGELKVLHDQCTKDCTIAIDDLKDPVTKDVFVDPIMLIPCGHTYSKDSIKNNKKTCPLCNASIEKKIENRAIKSLIDTIYTGTKVDYANRIDDLNLQLSMDRGFEIIKAYEEVKNIKFTMPDINIQIGVINYTLLDIINVVLATSEALNNEDNEYTISDDIPTTNLAYDRLIYLALQDPNFAAKTELMIGQWLSTVNIYQVYPN